MAITKQEQEALFRCLQTAKEASCPKEQAQSFVEHGYFPYPWQWEFHAKCREADRKSGPTKIGCGGSRGPGKSYAIFAQNTLDDCQRVAGLKGLFLRQTGKAAKESLEDLAVKVMAGKIKYEMASGVVRFPNGSKLVLGGFKDDKDIDKYIGIEYDFISIEEINQLTTNKINMLLGSMRTSKPNWRPRLYCSFNPGGVGHGYCKSTFVEPHRAGIEKDTRFIPATYKDNPNLNDEYIIYLEGLEGQLGRAWREGDFDILAGQYFTEWKYNIHVVEPFTIPDEWRKFGAMDYGYDKPSSLGWYTISPDGQLFRYRELYRSGLTYSKLAEEFVSMTPTTEKIEYLVADPSIWNRDGRNDNGLSGAEIFETRYHDLTKKGLRLERGNNDRLSGWSAVREYLRPYMRENIPTAKLQVFNNCTELIRTMPLQIHNPTNPEDLDTDLEDHAEDELRYAIMSRPSPRTTASQIEDKLFREAMKRKRQNYKTNSFYNR